MNKRNRAYCVWLLYIAVLGYLGGRSIINHNHVDLQAQAYAPVNLIAYKVPARALPEVEAKYTTVQNAPHGDILLRIWMNESGQGKSVLAHPDSLQAYCEKQGLSNEFGVSPQTHLCFKFFKDSVEFVSSWFDRMLKIHTLREALLIYSGNSTDYINKFINQ